MQTKLFIGPTLIEIRGAPPFAGGVVGVYERMDYMISSRPVYRQAFRENHYYTSTSDVGIQRRDSKDGQAFLDALRRISLHRNITEQCNACRDCAMMLYADGACFFTPDSPADKTKGPTRCTKISVHTHDLWNGMEELSPWNTLRFAYCKVGEVAVPLPDEYNPYEYNPMPPPCRIQELGQLLHRGYCADVGTVETGRVVALNRSQHALRELALVRDSKLPANDPLYKPLLTLLSGSPRLIDLAEPADAILGAANDTFLNEFEGNPEKAFHYLLYCNSKFLILRRPWSDDWEPSTAGEDFKFATNLNSFEYKADKCSDALLSSDKTEKFSVLKLTTAWTATDPKRGDVVARDLSVKQVSLPRSFGDDDPNDDMCNQNQDEGKERDLVLSDKHYSTCQCKDDLFGLTCAFPRICPELEFMGLPGGFPSNFVLLTPLANDTFNFELVGGDSRSLRASTCPPM
jgi:hypothetical protein